MIFIKEEVFNKANLQQAPLKLGKYEQYIFRNCDFSNADLSNMRFVVVSL
jgi:fluoroquinolone resistance protein